MYYLSFKSWYGLFSFYTRPDAYVYTQWVWVLMSYFTISFFFFYIKKTKRTEWPFFFKLEKVLFENQSRWLVSIYQRYVGSVASKRKTFLLPAPDLLWRWMLEVAGLQKKKKKRTEKEGKENALLPPSEGIIHSLRVVLGEIFKRLQPKYICGNYIIASIIVV